MPSFVEAEAVEPYEKLYEIDPDKFKDETVNTFEEYPRPQQQLPDDDPLVKYQYLLEDIEPDCN